MAGQQLFMAKSQVQFTKDNEYYTPKEFVSLFGRFDYDPATTKEKAEEFGLTRLLLANTNLLLRRGKLIRKLKMKFIFYFR
jgi:hypothetical protein